MAVADMGGATPLHVFTIGALTRFVDVEKPQGHLQGPGPQALLSLAGGFIGEGGRNTLFGILDPRSIIPPVAVVELTPLCIIIEGPIEIIHFVVGVAVGVTVGVAV